MLSLPDAAAAPNVTANDEDDATRMLSLPDAAAPPPGTPARGTATPGVSAAEKPRVAEVAKAEPPKPPAVQPALPVKPSSAVTLARKKPSQEVTGQTRIVPRVTAPNRKGSDLPRLLMLMAGAGVAGFVASQVMNARRATAPASPAAIATTHAAFEEKGARAAVVAALSAAGSACQPPVQSGNEIVASVWFQASGRVSRAKVEDPLGQTETGLCIVQRLHDLAIAPFDGAPVTLSARVVVP
jgi:hypothetical protein